MLLKMLLKSMELLLGAPLKAFTVPLTVQMAEKGDSCSCVNIPKLEIFALARTRCYFA